MIVLKIVKQLILTPITEVSLYRFVKLPEQIYRLLLQFAKENQIQVLNVETSTLPNENELIILHPQLILIHKFALCPAVQFLQLFYYSQLYNKYNFPII